MVRIGKARLDQIEQKCRKHFEQPVSQVEGVVTIQDVMRLHREHTSFALPEAILRSTETMAALGEPCPPAEVWDRERLVDEVASMIEQRNRATAPGQASPETNPAEHEV